MLSNIVKPVIYYGTCSGTAVDSGERAAGDGGADGLANTSCVDP